MVWKPVRLTRDEASGFLEKRLGDGVRDLTFIETHGLWSAAYAFVRDGQELVIRFGSTREGYDKDALVARHGSPALPIPRVLEIGPAFDGFYAISERAHGTHLDALGGAEMRRALPSLFNALDALRRIEPGGTGYGLWDAPGRGRSATWSEALVAPAGEWRTRLLSVPSAVAAFDETLARIRELVAFCPDERHLVHSDLLNDNVLVASDRVTAMLDWGSSIYGDYLFDVAWLAFWSDWYPAWREIDFADEARRHYQANGVRVDHFAERLRCYELSIGLDGLAFSAGQGWWDKIERTAQRALALARSPI